jgi:hypothetical protein
MEGQGGGKAQGVAGPKERKEKKILSYYHENSIGDGG